MTIHCNHSHATSSRSCHLSSDNFCYVLGYYISPLPEIKHTQKLVDYSKCFIAYEGYFGMRMAVYAISSASHLAGTKTTNISIIFVLSTHLNTRGVKIEEAQLL